MAGVAQLVRAPDCDSGSRGFKSHHSPHFLRVILCNLLRSRAIVVIKVLKFMTHY